MLRQRTAQGYSIENRRAAQGLPFKKVREELPMLAKKSGKEHLWSSAYYVGTAGPVSTETIKRYITECRGQ
jgi:REP element-mobilizing transposase RayT